MDQELTNYIDKLVAECMSIEAFAQLSEQDKEDYSAAVKRQLQIVIFQTLLDNLTPYQLREIENLDFADPASDIKVAELSGSIPNFAILLHDALDQEVQKIIQHHSGEKVES